jgi:hypothetical protein
MQTTLHSVLPDEWKTERLNTGLTHFPLMDCIIYIERDVSYISKRIDDHLSLLFAPDLEIVGVQIDNIHALCVKMRDIVHSIAWAAQGMEEMPPFLADMIFEAQSKTLSVPYPLDALISASVVALGRTTEAEPFLDDYEMAIQFAQEHPDAVIDPYAIIRNAALKIHG